MSEVDVFIVWAKEPNDVVFVDIVSDINQAYGSQRKKISEYKEKHLDYGVFVKRTKVMASI